MAKKNFVSAKDAKKGDYSKGTSKDTSTARTEGRKKNAMKFRIPAIILWVLAIGCEAVAVWMLNLNNMTWLYVALGVDALLVIIGSLLWKKANHISPCTSKSKAVCFLQNQMGVIAALLAFIPFGIILLRGAKNVDAKTKKILAVVVGVLLLGSVGASIDYTPATPDSVAAAELVASASGDFNGTVYWTEFGKSYHLDPECSTLSRSTNIAYGSIEDAFELKRNDPCDICAGGDLAKEEAAKLIQEAEAAGESVEDMAQEATE